MRDKYKLWLGQFKKLLGWIFGIAGAVSVFFPLSDAAPSNFKYRLLIFALIVAVIALMAIISARIEINRKRHKVYSREKTNIWFEYADFRDIIKNAEKNQEAITIVVPVNTGLDIVFDRMKITKNTVHRLCLDYIYMKRRSDLDAAYLDKIVVKKDGFTNKKTALCAQAKQGIGSCLLQMK